MGLKKAWVDKSFRVRKKIGVEKKVSGLPILEFSNSLSLNYGLLIFGFASWDFLTFEFTDLGLLIGAW